MSTSNAEKKSINAQFFQYLRETYSELRIENFSDRLICAAPIVLDLSLIKRIQTELKSYSALRSWGQQNLSSLYSKYGLRTPQNFSVCDSYDFHIDQNGNPQLIEINTNAAFCALGMELYRFFDLKLGVKNSFEFSERALVDMFREEIKMSGAQANVIYIIDEKPSEQKMFLEFELFQSIFKRNGIECFIVDATDEQSISQIPKNSFVYNRHTDFYLSDLKSKRLKDRFNSGELHLSPHPWEYFLIADKQRFLDWNQQTAVPHPSSLLKTYDVDSAPEDTLWSIRKNLFFKPKSSFGSKGVFKGASISRTAFDRFAGQGFMAQVAVPAPEVDLNVEIMVENSGSAQVENKIQKMKYDLRCYTYQDQLQMIIARVYQGQTTNLRTEGGGFAIVLVEN